MRVAKDLAIESVSERVRSGTGISTRRTARALPREGGEGAARAPRHSSCDTPTQDTAVMEAPLTIDLLKPLPVLVFKDAHAAYDFDSVKLEYVTIKM